MNQRQCLYIMLFILIVSAFTLSAEYDLKQQQMNNQQFCRWQNGKSNYQPAPRWLKGMPAAAEFRKYDHSQLPSSRDPIDVKVNGLDQTTIVQGENIVLTIYFSDNCFTAELTMWADMNGNGIWEDNIDLIIPDGNQTIIDNSIDDEDPAVGVFQKTIEAEEGPSMVANFGLFMVGEDTGGIDDAYVFINPITSNYSISGAVTPAAAGIIIMAMNEDEELWMTASNANGSYQVFVQTPGMYFVMAFDPLGVYNGLFADPGFYEINVNGHLNGYNFNFIEGNCTIQGTVTDENGTALEGLTVYLSQDGPTSIWDITDVNGFYQVTVIEGYWEIRFNEEELMPDYMNIEDEWVYIEEGNTEIVDITLYETDSFIEGTVYLDGVPTPGFEIEAWNDMVGHSFTISSANGSYDLPVASEANSQGGYNVYVNIWEIPGLYVDEYYNNVPSGSMGIDFHVHTASGGVHGYIYDSVTLQPIEDSWVSAFDGMNYYNAGVNDEGFYELYLPNGTFDVWAEGEMYYQEFVEGIVVGDDFITIDFYLDPIILEGAVEGFVYEMGTTNTIPYADVWVSNDFYWTGTTSDENGFYHIDLPNGTFWMDVWHPLYYSVHHEDILINSNIVILNIEMEPVSFDGALEGYVYESGSNEPISYATIEIYGEYYTVAYSDENGFYHADLPNGGYNALCWKYGYIEDTLDWFEINDNTIINDFYLISLVNSDDVLTADKISLCNFPNPFNPSTTISFSLTAELTNSAAIEIYNLKGQKVKTLDCSNSFAAKAGDSRSTYSVVWDGADENNKPVSSGIYFYKLRAGEIELIRKCLLLK